jgi:hypothetical protein
MTFLATALNRFVPRVKEALKILFAVNPLKYFLEVKFYAIINLRLIDLKYIFQFKNPATKQNFQWE